jgi:hypothetical protein
LSFMVKDYKGITIFALLLNRRIRKEYPPYIGLQKVWCNAGIRTYGIQGRTGNGQNLPGPFRTIGGAKSGKGEKRVGRPRKGTSKGFIAQIHPYDMGLYIGLYRCIYGYPSKYIYTLVGSF